MKTCDVCKGAKQIRGLGMMKEDCHGCNGLGTVEEPAIKPISAYTNDLIFGNVDMSNHEFSLTPIAEMPITEAKPKAKSKAKKK